ncbi:MAG: glutamine--fructose-6-phosphate aminotransferase [Spirochaetes bacterium GWD1_61_31]|nr:MAG: glutamine--fructose-6-phosphate aminotransferase [Spirochaetes bacterium GWB1_60_80]OHD32379.1 MAG: glutamine--fructose-6-phosphate aminotransferase [Spirochaetes bacterium GWC1_61_12]OHD38060.1 MAG: glutamine--fructose-6-phosphate aminotransferase [Spirochaetes bacterium GWD1_61_31]OHD44546.1 MAG: glutamine--fructose-6-phosphate aminotransferase [Spirochaetes bacterium GWE1_60_18]OHD58666.1 MAG: glutamine--fructose-6-phosphate aminotransferase [Spirochaetes bacterium GWF1_60_12]HAP432
MCGITGYTGPKQASRILVDGLKRLEYRGYDSAGIAVQTDPADQRANALTVIKRVGKIASLRQAVPKDLSGHCGIGHTRWATHGEVNEVNAHPHADGSNRIAIVHNGIIENYLSLKGMLEHEGMVFASQTDSEVIAHLVAYHYDGDLEAALKAALKHLKGTFGIGCVCSQEPGRIVGARNGSPLVVGVGDGEMFLASDVNAMLAHTKRVVYLNDGEVVSLWPHDFRISDGDDQSVDPKIDHVTWELDAIEKEGFGCYMEKEIFEQPDSIERALKGRMDSEYGLAKLGGLNLSKKELHAMQRVRVIAAGTSWHAGLVGCHLVESIARLPALAELASELRYRNPVVEPGTLYLSVSQSGETADTLYAMREVQRRGGTVLGICNVVGSTIARESDGGIYVHSGPEIAVASTKAFTSQLAAFYLLTLSLARMHDMSHHDGSLFLSQLKAIPGLVKRALEQRDLIQALAKKYCHCSDFLFLGRGLLYPIALEGALKLKEISYIHAEGYAAGEIKHGPIALVSPQTPSVFLVPNDHLREKTITNLKEIKARGGPVIAIASEKDLEVAAIADDFIPVPDCDSRFQPFTMIVPLQLFAYFCALELGRDVDQPRNLAKSVTVE